MGKHGKNGLVLQHSGELTTDRFGLASGKLTFTVPPNRWDLMPQPGSVHPYAAFAFLERRRVIFTPGLWTVQGDYNGSEREASEPVYELQREAQREPIETHPHFVTRIAGKPSAPLNGALFVDESGWPTSDDAVGVFSGFRITLDGQRNKFAGVDAYLAPTNTSWVGQWTSRARPSLRSEVGKIDSHPAGNPPNFGSGWEWLYTGINFTKRAGAYQNRESWLLGRWITEIYSDA